MNLLDRIKTFLHLQRVVNGKPKSKFRLAFSSGLLRRKENIRDNPLLAYSVRHPFKPVARCAVNVTANGHNYKRLMNKMRLGKLKPKQLRMANETLRTAGFSMAD